MKYYKFHCFLLFAIHFHISQIFPEYFRQMKFCRSQFQRYFARINFHKREILRYFAQIIFCGKDQYPLDPRNISPRKLIHLRQIHEFNLDTFTLNPLMLIYIKPTYVPSLMLIFGQGSFIQYLRKTVISYLMNE